MLIRLRGNKFLPFYLVAGIILLLTSAVFIADLLTPLGITSGIAYILLMFLGYWLPGRLYIYLYAALCCILTVADYVLTSDMIAPVWAVLTNKMLALVGILVAAYFTERFRYLSKSHGFNEKMLQATLACATEAIMVVDEKGEIIYVNKSTKDIFGYAKDELIGKPIEVLVPPHIRHKHVQYRNDFIKDPHARPMALGRNLSGVRKDGSSLPVEISLSYFRIEGNLYITCFVMDITRRKQAEDGLNKLNAELEESNKMLKLANSDLQQFLYATSHELQEPMRMIFNYARLIKDKTENKLPLDVQQNLDFLMNESKRMKRIIVAVSQYLEINNKDKFDELVNCNAILEEAKLELKQEIECSNATIIAENDLPSIKGNSEQIRHLFIELIDNAIKFRSQAPPEILISSKDKITEWEFRIKDNGISLDPKYIDHIFSIFKKIHAQNEYEGPGMGLAIAHKVVSHHSGRIWYEASAGKGTAFYFTIAK